MTNAPLVQLVEYEAASPEAKAVYDDIMKTRGTDWINNFWKVLAHDPVLLKRTWESVKEVMAPGALDALTKEMIYVAISASNGCEYCTYSHTAAARAKVREYAGLGLQHVKLYWKLLAPEFEAAAVAAKEQGLIAAAHVDNGLYSMDAALAHGVRHFEHFFTLVPSILDTRRHGPALEREFGIGRAQNIDELAARFVLFFAYVKQRPELEARLLAQMDRLAAADASLSTAIHVVGAAAGATTLFSSFDPLPERDAPQLRGWDDEQRRRLRAAFDTMMGFVRAAHERGVRLRIGTDCREGGRAVLSELRLLCEAGFETADVLQIATWNGADAMGLCAEVGVVEVGRRASMILWQDDPLADPAHLQGDKIVIHEGVVLGEPR